MLRSRWCGKYSKQLLSRLSPGGHGATIWQGLLQLWPGVKFILVQNMVGSRSKGSCNSIEASGDTMTAHQTHKQEGLVCFLPPVMSGQQFYGRGWGKKEPVGWRGVQFLPQLRYAVRLAAVGAPPSRWGHVAMNWEIKASDKNTYRPRFLGKKLIFI